MLDTTPELMRADETASYLRISITTLYRLVRDSQIPATKVGSRWRFKRASIDRWLAGQEFYAGSESRS